MDNQQMDILKVTVAARRWLEVESEETRRIIWMGWTKGKTYDKGKGRDTTLITRVLLEKQAGEMKKDMKMSRTTTKWSVATKLTLPIIIIIVGGNIAEGRKTSISCKQFKYIIIYYTHDYYNIICEGFQI